MRARTPASINNRAEDGGKGEAKGGACRPSLSRQPWFRGRLAQAVRVKPRNAGPSFHAQQRPVPGSFQPNINTPMPAPWQLKRRSAPNLIKHSNRKIKIFWAKEVFRQRLSASISPLSRELAAQKERERVTVGSIN